MMAHMKNKKVVFSENRTKAVSILSPLFAAVVMLFGVSDTASAGVRLPSTVSNHMVVQRDKPFVLSGFATPGAMIDVSFGEEKKSVETDGQGAWQIRFPAFPASSAPRKLQIVGDETTLTYTNIVVGDVYVVTGSTFGPQVRKSSFKPDALKDSFRQSGLVRTLNIGGQRESFENPDGLYEKGFVKYGAWRPIEGIVSHTPLFVIGLGRALDAKSTVPVGLIFADARTERLEAILPATRYRAEGLIELADAAEAMIPGTECGDAAISNHLKAVKKWFDESAKALDEGRVPAGKCPTFTELKETDFGSAWNGILSPLKAISVKGVIVSEAKTRDSDELRGQKENALSKFYRSVWGEGIDVVFIPVSNEQIQRGEALADQILR